MMFRMMTSHDPNFSLYPLRDDVTMRDIEMNETVLRVQMREILWKRKLLRGLRSQTLFGTVPIETPWMSQFSSGQVSFEATDFIPRSLLQFAFDPTVSDIRLSDWYIVMDVLSPTKLRHLAKTQPGIWDGVEIERAIEEMGTVTQVNRRVSERLSRAGYSLEDKKALLVTTRWGCDEDGVEMVSTIINEKFLVRHHENPFPDGRRPFLISTLNDFELEPYAYGVGAMGKRTQAELDANRNRNNDLMTFSQFHMWKMSRNSGLRTRSIRIVPFKVLEMEDIAGLEPLRPDLAGLKAGLEHEDRLKEEYRAITGAMTNLQAGTTEATATEASITQNEAVRRVAVLAEVSAEDQVRNYIYTCLQNNAAFLDRPVWVNITGDAPPMAVFPQTLKKSMGVEAKITTDKDFRPERTRRMIEFLQIISSVRQQIPASVNIMPIVEEIARSFNIDSKKIFGQNTAMDQILNASRIAQSMREGAGGAAGEVEFTDGGPGGAPSTVTTPVGDVAGSPPGAS